MRSSFYSTLINYNERQFRIVKISHQQTEIEKLARSYYRAETLAEVNYSDFENFVSLY